MAGAGRSVRQHHMDYGCRHLGLLDAWRPRHRQVRMALREGGQMMTWVSVGIFLLAIGTVMKAQRDSEYQIREAFSEGFRLGAETVIERSYETLESFEKENGLTSAPTESVR